MGAALALAGTTGCPAAHLAGHLLQLVRMSRVNCCFYAQSV